ncbi:MAG TPA: divalent-cation tolerance protein CutA [Dehalococcoidales bacterium]|nr:divalent-cation tolerance protein CutA [Dehalococcoidales bacterium]
MEFRYIVVLVTVNSEETAEKITEALLDSHKAACVNIVQDVDSHYWWKGKKESAEESLLIIKTRAELLDDVVKLVKANHPYSVPEIIALPIIGGNEDYLKWIDEETR